MSFKNIEKRGGGLGTKLWVDSIDGLVAMVDIGVIELHQGNATIEDLEHPDEMIFDLDPGDGVAWEFVVETAVRLRQYLKDESEFSCWPKATEANASTWSFHVMASAPTTPPERFPMKSPRASQSRIAALPAIVASYSAGANLYRLPAKWPRPDCGRRMFLPCESWISHRSASDMATS
jgi:hypothetical protein